MAISLIKNNYLSLVTIGRGVTAMCAHLQWMVVWNYCSFLIKQTYSPEPDALKVCNSVHYKGLIFCKTVGAEPTANVKGFVVVMKCRSGQ